MSNNINGFDWEFYVSYYNDLSHIKTEKEAISHYLSSGRQEKRRISNIPIDFDWKFYTNFYYDLNHISNKEDAENHYLQYGKFEDRLFSKNMIAKNDSGDNKRIYFTVPKSVKTTMKFDIMFLSDIPTQSNNFAIKSHCPKIHYKNWLTKCKTNQFVHIEIPMFLSKQEQFITFIADSYYSELSFRVKNVEFCYENEKKNKEEKVALVYRGHYKRNSSKWNKKGNSYDIDILKNHLDSIRSLGVKHIDIYFHSYSINEEEDYKLLKLLSDYNLVNFSLTKDIKYECAYSVIESLKMVENKYKFIINTRFDLFFIKQLKYFNIANGKFNFCFKDHKEYWISEKKTSDLLWIIPYRYVHNLINAANETSKYDPTSLHLIANHLNLDKSELNFMIDGYFISNTDLEDNYFDTNKYCNINNFIYLKRDDLNNKKRIYFLCGNARTFLTCFDSVYMNIIDKLFCNNTKNNTHVLFYLKCDDPGPKGQKDWDFEYKELDKTELENKIFKFTEKYKNITFHSEILLTSKISDSQLLAQVKNRKLYTEFLGDDKKLIRGLHFHYNFEDCGKIINRIESENKFHFDFYIYIRPDLFFESPCQNISKYNTDKIIMGKVHPFTINDHYAVIPCKYKYEFFFARMELYRTNNKIKFNITEEIYFHTTKDISYVKEVGKYVIKRK